MAELRDPRAGVDLSETLAGMEHRDVLAKRIEKWADTGDWHVYDYVDRLLADLDAAGFQIVRRREEFVEQPRGAVLMLAVHLPDEDAEHNDPDEAADSIVAALNGARFKGKSRAESASVNLWPDPQWMTPQTLKVLAEARALSKDEAPEPWPGIIGYLVAIREHDQWNDTWDGVIHPTEEAGLAEAAKARGSGWDAIAVALVRLEPSGGGESTVTTERTGSHG